ncbi:MAG: WG repeat-containing protein [Candidatus Obscuribacterales bacterium]|nr:WG repeat-containing protein [Candidatus Obscuribacterales bacterium]
MISSIYHLRQFKWLCSLLVSLTIGLSHAQAGLSATFPQLRDVIIDSHGHEVVHGDFSAIRYKGAGLFLAAEFYYSCDWHREKSHLLTRDGKEIRPKVPQGTVFTDIYFPSGAPEKDIDSAEALPPNSVIEIHTEKGVGLANMAGDIILEPKYRQIGGCWDGIFTFYDDKKWDAFDPQGKSNQADSIYVKMFRANVSHGKLCAGRIAFSEGADGPKKLWGYYDSEGKVCIAPSFSKASDFTEDGFARVWLPYNDGRTRRCVLIDRSGKTISANEYEDISEYRGGCAVVAIRSKDDAVRKGLIDKKQHYVLQPEWEKLDYLSDNKYAAQSRAGKALNVIDTNGKVLFEIPHSTTIATETEGLVACLYSAYLNDEKVSRAHSFMKVFDSQGKVVSNQSQTEELAVSDGMILCTPDPNIFLKERRWTIISKSGVTADGIIACRIQPTTNDRLIKTYIYKKFSPEIWKNIEHDRPAEFANFLREFDFIGMPRPRVEQLLGPPDFKTCYRTASDCTSMNWIEVQYKDGLVTGWRRVYRDFTRTEFNKPWVTVNVTYDFSWAEVYSFSARNEPRFVLKE